MKIIPYRFSSVITPYAPPTVRNYPVEYFSGADVSFFFNEQHIDEIVGLQFSLIEKCVPVYSYANYTPNVFIHGTRMVQGQFAINVRAGDYLHELLYKNISAAINTAQSGLPILPAPSEVVPDPTKDPQGFKEWVAQQQSQFWDVQSQAIQAGATPDFSKNPYYLNNGFTILIVYGEVDTNDFSRNIGRVRTIDNVHIWSTAQTISIHNGEAVGEVWNFCAADINVGNRDALSL